MIMEQNDLVLEDVSSGVKKHEKASQCFPESTMGYPGATEPKSATFPPFRPRTDGAIYVSNNNAKSWVEKPLPKWVISQIAGSSSLRLASDGQSLCIVRIDSNRKKVNCTSL
jgi:hypothetical protein